MSHDTPAASTFAPAAIGVIGGSGLYQMDALTDPRELRLDTPFGPPSDVIFGGRLAGRDVYFLPRHGRGHRLLPTEIPHRANLWALRSLGVRFLLQIGAVGSLRADLPPRHIVLPDQFFDRTSRRREHTFFGAGIVAHVGFAEPTSAALRRIVAAEAAALGLPIHNGGTYVNMDGPAFSTRAESETNRRLGFDVIGMTNLPEAKLAREAEIATASIAFVTDYDCWKIEEEPVSVATVLGHLLANAATAKALLARVIPRLPATADWPEHSALDTAIVTDKSLWPAETVARLRPILERFK
ncbi:MAG: S-methyl-5'-thioadenosine phosphorylase [Verrucomicrobia bacterium]|nr:S-methyl-5'-thioadenosine phosphorylase [Verrucomicrobiota bacterium]